MINKISKFNIRRKQAIFIENCSTWKVVGAAKIWISITSNTTKKHRENRRRQGAKGDRQGETYSRETDSKKIGKAGIHADSLRCGIRSVQGGWCESETRSETWSEAESGTKMECNTDRERLAPSKGAIRSEVRAVRRYGLRDELPQADRGRAGGKFE